ASKEDLKELSHGLVGDYQKSQLMWKSKPLPFTTWLLKWNRAWWIRDLFGRTLKPSRQRHFTERYTESLAVIPASLKASPETSLETKMTDSFGGILNLL